MCHGALSKVKTAYKTSNRSFDRSQESVSITSSAHLRGSLYVPSLVVANNNNNNNNIKAIKISRTHRRPTLYVRGLVQSLDKKYGGRFFAEGVRIFHETL